MALWLVRAGKRGEHEAKFLADSIVYLTWEKDIGDLAKAKDQKAVIDQILAAYPERGVKTAANQASQVLSFAMSIKPGDWVVTPSKFQPSLHVAEVTGDYVHVPQGPAPYYHARKVKWLVTDLPRSAVEQDLLYSLGAFMSVCRIQRNDAEARFRTLGDRGWTAVAPASKAASATQEATAADLEELARDDIARIIRERFAGHELAGLVSGILRSQGYQVLQSAPGPDKGVDILAGRGPLGFDPPRLCVQVKSGSEPADSDTLMKLKGSISHVNATHGLLVSLSGFKGSVLGATQRAEFFNIRLWGQEELIQNLLAEYQGLDANIRATLPLKQIWTVAIASEE